MFAPHLRFFQAVVERNSDRARRRYLRACSRASDPDLDARVDGAVASVPPDDEAFPVDPADMRLSLPPHVIFLLGSQDPRPAVQTNPNTPVSSASKRPGAALEASSNRDQQPSRDHNGGIWHFARE